MKYFLAVAMMLTAASAYGQTAPLRVNQCPSLIVGKFYTCQVGTGGVPPYHCTTLSLPNGLSLSSDCVLSGTPTNSNTVVLTIIIGGPNPPTNLRFQITLKARKHEKHRKAVG